MTVKKLVDFDVEIGSLLVTRLVVEFVQVEPDRICRELVSAIYVDNLLSLSFRQAWGCRSGYPPDDSDRGGDATENDGGFHGHTEQSVFAFSTVSALWGWSWCGGGVNRGFESGEAFFEGAGDGEESEEGGFGDVAALVCVGEQGCA